MAKIIKISKKYFRLTKNILYCIIKAKSDPHLCCAKIDRVNYKAQNCKQKRGSLSRAFDEIILQG